MTIACCDAVYLINSALMVFDAAAGQATAKYIAALFFF